MKVFSLFVAALFSLNAQALEIDSTKIVQLETDKDAYVAGETAILRATLLTAPVDTRYELDTTQTWDDAPLASDRITQFEFFAKSPNLTTGVHQWKVTTYIQDARLARDLKITASNAQKAIDEANASLVDEEDPQIIAELQAIIIKNTELRDAALSQLAAIRTKVNGPINKNITVN